MEHRSRASSGTSALASALAALTILGIVLLIAGVGFFDETHGPRGVAPKGIELHPVLVFTSSNCRARSSA
jgi:hypothetical protein